MRKMSLRLRLILVVLAAGLLWLLGAAVNADGVSNHASTNAFLFLMGLGGALALLSPSHLLARRRRDRRYPDRSTQAYYPGPRVSSRGVMHWY
jgi:hypothetical protein